MEGQVQSADHLKPVRNISDTLMRTDLPDWLAL